MHHGATAETSELDKNVFTLWRNRDVGFRSVAVAQPHRPSQASPLGTARQTEQTQAILIDRRTQRGEERKGGVTGGMK